MVVCARKLLILKDLRPLGSVVEHSLHTRGVRSSNLLAGTNIFNKLRATLQLLASPVFRCTHFRTHFELKNDHDFSRIASGVSLPHLSKIWTCYRERIRESQRLMESSRTVSAAKKWAGLCRQTWGLIHVRRLPFAEKSPLNLATSIS